MIRSCYIELLLKCQKLIFEKRDAWFQNSLEENDIESAFNSTIRVYKSGKYYLVRTNIKNNHNNLPTIKIYNEEEIPLTMDDIKAETNIISILEIQGIKFTSRNFQIEIDLKQIMVLDNEPIFETSTTPLRENMYETEPGSAILPSFLVITKRTSPAALFLLSVKHSIKTATPFGP